MMKCLFKKVKNNGKTWSPPIIVVDTYLPDGHGGITYLGNGKLIINYGYFPGDVVYHEMYYRVGMGFPRTLAMARQAMVDTYRDIPPEKLVGGCFVKMSDDYGMTWSDAVRVPVSTVHGLCQTKDGTLLLLGKEAYADPSKTLEEGLFDPAKRPEFESWSEYLVKRLARRMMPEAQSTPLYVIASMDGGYTWEKRGTCVLPQGVAWSKAFEPHLMELEDGTLLSSVRIESDIEFENDFTVFLARSTDGGYTWDEFEPTHIPGSPPHLLKHSSGKLICAVGCRLEEDGYGIYAYVSEDDGKTFTSKYVINDRSPNNDLGYPASVELDDGSVLTIYYQRYYDEKTGIFDDKPCIMCTRWTL